ncbi:MAG TPA: 2-oxoacid:acceptor oxidoreductase subunit alpha [Dehalococcoidia bacterium]|nr:2-oxoacid:acceptor oxidoreductase subunit alpha [Dehalococcoidia bacterium]
MTTEARPQVLTGTHFMNGDTASAEGAVAAGCMFFAGYPITPSTEVAERLSQRLPEVGGRFIQMEDELASIAAVLGASWGGARAMTATSGPGFTLMMENLGLAVMTETPCVIVDVQRGSPSTGLPTAVGQSDVMQARWGSHGDYQIVAYSPASPQEMFDLTVTAFNTADRLRIPVVILADEVIGHMTERVTIPDAEAIERVARRKPGSAADNGFLPYLAGEDLVPPMPDIGAGYRVHVTGLTHDERGYPTDEPERHERLVRRLNEKVTRQAEDLIDCEGLMLDDASVVVIAYGCVTRSARQAVKEARARGLRVGLLRPITIWPFPGDLIKRLSEHVDRFVVAELNLGQIAGETERYTARPVTRVDHAGGRLLTPQDILAGIGEATS